MPLIRFILSPGIIRAFLGFLLGFAIGLFIVGVVRAVQTDGPLGILGFLPDVPGYYVNLNDSEHLFMGRFATDEALLMFGLLFGAFGFVWGSGALWGTPIGPKEANPYAIVAVKPKKSRIPSDPDAPINMNTPARQILGMAPSTIIIIGVILLMLVLMGLVIASDIDTPQVYSEEASAGSFGEETTFDFLGVVEITTNKALMFIGFGIIVILLVLGAPLSLALGFYLLNREVKEAEAEAPNPEAGQDFILVRLAGFFNQWAIDALNTAGGRGNKQLTDGTKTDLNAFLEKR